MENKNNILKALVKLGLTDFQVQKLTRSILDMLKINEENQNQRPKVCPKCKSETACFIKKGVNTGKQRFMCKDCHRVFVWDVNKLTYWSKVSFSKWIDLIQDTLSLVPIRKTAAKLDVSQNTVFEMRHKLLCALELVMDQEVLSEVIEADDTYVLQSQKGKECEDREPRKRGSPASKRGLSKELICIMVMTDRKGSIIAKAIDKGKPSAPAITQNFTENIEENSSLLTDGLRSFNDISKVKNCTHHVLVSHKEYDNLLHLNTVNYIHGVFNRMIAQYRGVSSKYLKRYSALLRFVRLFQDMDFEEIMSILLKELYSINSYVSSELLKTHCLSYF